MKKIFVFACAAGMVVAQESDTTPAKSRQVAEWVSAVRQDHPRLMVNAETLPHVRELATTRHRDALEKLSSEVDSWVETPELKFHEERFSIEDGTIKSKGSWGQGFDFVKRSGATEAEKCAFLYLVTGEGKYAEKGKAWLRVAVDFFNWCHEHKILVDWHCSLRHNAIFAYDWLPLTSAERKELGGELLRHVEATQSAPYHKNGGDGVTNGHYGEGNIRFFVGLAALGDGADDTLAERLLRVGLEKNIYMLEFREKISVGTGLLVAPTPGYSFGMYPFATFFFFHLMQSACGKDLADTYPQMLDYPNWFHWAQIPAKDGPLVYGIGDQGHENNQLGTNMMYTHLSQSVHFYGKNHPERMRAIYDTIDTLPEKHRNYNHFYPLLQFFLTGFDPALLAASETSKEATETPKKLSAHFPPFGLLFMRSGDTPDDTFSVFRFGSQFGHHSQYDENAFVIYNRNFMAMDSGSRTHNMHHVHYAPQTIAHNAILIHEDKEEQGFFWRPWGGSAELSDETIYSDGGQYRTEGGLPLAGEDAGTYLYAAGDAAPTYRASKAKSVVRQFVFIRPDYFVIYDRVESQRPDQKKTWLLHTQNEPLRQTDGSLLATFGEGKIFIRTFLDGTAQTVGGEGKEFFASGRNWPLPGDNWLDHYKYAGNWRVEVTPPAEAATARFLNFLQVGDHAAMAAAQPADTPDQDGIAFTAADGKRWTVRFNREGSVGGNILCTGADGKIEAPFATSLQFTH